MGPHGGISALGGDTEGLRSLPRESTVRSSCLQARQGMLLGRCKEGEEDHQTGWKEGLTRGDTRPELEGKAFDT